MTDTTASLPILTAVNVLFQTIRAKHPEIPNAVIVVGASGKQRRGQVHGHFAPKSWHGDQHEILLSGESLARGAVSTLGTLIHESAHALAHEKEVQDTSNNGRYHNKKFKVIAESLGITLEQGDTIGWSVTSVPESTAAEYSVGLERLTEALTTWREPREEKQTKKPTNSTRVKIECACGDDGVSVSKKWFEAHEPSLFCEDCLEHFNVVGE